MSDKTKSYQYDLWSEDIRFLYDSLRVEVLEEMKKRGIESIPITCKEGSKEKNE